MSTIFSEFFFVPNLEKQMKKISYLTKISLIISAVMTIACFALLIQLLNWHIAFLLLGVILAMPSVMALFKASYYRSSFSSNLFALCLVVFLASALLWQALLSDGRVDLSANLLILMLALIIASVQQLLWLNNKPVPDKISLQKQIEQALSPPPIVNTLCIAVIMTSVVMAWLFSVNHPILSIIATKFLDRGIIPPITLSLFFWGLLLLMSKWLLMAQEMKKFNHHDHATFNFAYDHAKQNNISKQAFVEVLWQQFEAFYAIPRYINWAIPILGFIGTVLGISLATQSLGGILQNQESGVEQLLASVLTPLGIAFDTTLIALSLSIVLALMQTLLYRWEERHIHDIEEFL